MSRIFKSLSLVPYNKIATGCMVKKNLSFCAIRHPATFGYHEFNGKGCTKHLQSHKNVYHGEIGFAHRRQLWGWLNSVFNRYDESRVKEVGPNRACAEWLLRCGAGVRWKTHDKYLKDYNSLPVGGMQLKIAEVDGTDSAIMSIGFEHFRGCKDITKVILHKASYIDDEALRELRYLRHTLTHLQVSVCGDVTSKGLQQLAHLTELKYLLLYDLPSVKDKDEILKYLTEKLPECEIVFTYATDTQYEAMKKQQQLEEEDKNKDKPRP